MNGYSAIFGRAFEMRAQQRRLAGVRQADERRVGEQLQPKLDRRPPRPACRPPRSAASGGWAREALVATAAAAAFRDDDACARMREIGDEPLLARRAPASRPAPRARRPRRARRSRAAASAAALPGLEPLVRADAREVAPPRVGDEYHVAAVAAVAAVRPALRDELLPAEVHGAVAAAAGDDGQSGSVVEHLGVKYGVLHEAAAPRRAAS